MKKLDFSLTKNYSKAIQGIAILLMMFHHLFSDAALFGESAVLIRIAWTGRLCVGLYAFTGGYGIYIELSKKTQDTMPGTLAACYKSVLIRILKLFVKLWAVLGVYLLVNALIIHTPIDLSVKSLFLNALAIEPTYSGVWWYVRQYAIMLLLAPLVYAFCNTAKIMSDHKKTAIFHSIFAIVGVLTLAVMVKLCKAFVIFLQPPFIMVFFVGFLFARYRVYETVAKVISRESFCLFVSMLCLVGALLARFMLTDFPEYAKTDFLIMPFLVFGLIGILNIHKCISKFFCLFGGLSTFMWLTHGIIFETLRVTFYEWLYSRALLFVVLTLITMAVSLLFTLVDNLLKKVC